MITARNKHNSVGVLQVIIVKFILVLLIKYLTDRELVFTLRGSHDGEDTHRGEQGAVSHDNIPSRAVAMKWYG